MKKLILILVCLAIVGMAIPAYCAEGTGTTAPMAAKITKGSVTKIDKEKKAIDVKSVAGTEETFMIIEGIKIMKDGKEIGLADIVVDDKVTVTKKGDKIESIVVEVIPIIPEKKAETPVK